jgi:membrane protease YdiL (CAAX protease family)
MDTLWTNLPKFALSVVVAVGLTLVLAVALGVAGRLKMPILTGLGIDPATPLVGSGAQAVLYIGGTYLLYILTNLVAKWLKIDLSIRWGIGARAYRWLWVFIGLLIGFLAQVAIIWLVYQMGYGKEKALPEAITVIGAGMAFLTAVSEEIPFRAFLLGTTTKLVGIPFALFISSLLFGQAHVMPYAEAFGVPPTAAVFLGFVGGLMFAYAYRIHHNLWLPIGLHTGWNLFVGIYSGMIQPEMPGALNLATEMVVIVVIVAGLVEWKLWQNRRIQVRIGQRA